jgi:uncharacterized membrane protein
VNGATVYFKGLVTILCCAGLFVALAIPLALRKVPRNGLYGFRTPKTLSDDLIWYEANAYFGRALLVASLLTAAAIVTLYSAGGFGPEAYMNWSLVALVAPLAVAILLTFRRISRMGGSA